jgi:uncharacterized protein YkwD/uncharacterized membrane protein required for colicin V production
VLDFLLGALLVALAVRGWWRGLLREAVSLGVIVVGLVVAFRLSTPLGNVIEGMAGVSPEVGRLAGGLAIYLAISVGAAVVSAVLHKGIRFVPGLPTLNRFGGAAFAVVAVLAVATIGLSLLTIVTPPRAVADQVEGSSFAGYLTDPDQVPQKAMGVISGDRSIERLLNLTSETGSRRVVPGEEGLLLAPVAADDIEPDPGAANDLLEMVNRERDEAGADPLVTSDALARIALEHAMYVYETGRYGVADAAGGDVHDRLAAADIPVVAADQVMALAVDSESAQGALLDDAGSRSLLDPGFRRVGVAVVKGPLGTLVVEVLAG